MSEQYLAWFDGAEHGPMGYDDLNSLALSRGIQTNTPVRESDSPTWLTWDDIRARQVKALAESANARYQAENERRAIEATPVEIAKRDALRKRTAYPFLRLFGSIMIGLSIASTVLFWLLVFAGYGFWALGAAIGSTISIPCTVFSNGIAQALIDLADVSLRKID